jgi:hypothetical protein
MYVHFFCFIAMMISPPLMFYFYFSVETVGSGPGQSVWEALIKMLINKQDHWTEVTDGFYIPVITAVPLTLHAITQYTTYGLIL